MDDFRNYKKVVIQCNNCDFKKRKIHLPICAIEMAKEAMACVNYWVLFLGSQSISGISACVL